MGGYRPAGRKWLIKPLRFKFTCARRGDDRGLQLRQFTKVGEITEKLSRKCYFSAKFPLQNGS